MHRRSDIASERWIDLQLRRLNLQQKVLLVSGAGFWNTCAEPAIGLQSVLFSDGPAGVRGKAWDERDPSVCLPCPTALGATWDEALVARLCNVLAAEAQRKRVHVVLGPTLNLHRSPLGGRHAECFSEDPLLCGRLGVAYVNTLQSFGIGTAPKHYVANDSETGRKTVDIQLDERTLREVYLAPFERVVSAGAWLVMAAYNSVNGHTMTEHPLLTEPLKGEWGFDGVVVSDWTAVRSTEAAAVAGTDLAMPGPAAVWTEPLLSAVVSGHVPEHALDTKVRRILRLASRVGALGAPCTQPVKARVNTAAVLREAAATSMVLLRNEGDMLPLNINQIRSISLIGPNAVDPQIQCEGSATVVPAYIVSPLDGVRAVLRDDVEVRHHAGDRTGQDLSIIPISLLTNPVTGMPGVRVRFLASDGTEIRSEDRLASQLVWVSDEIAGVNEIELRTRLRACCDGLHQLGVKGVGHYRLEVNGTVLFDERIAIEDLEMANSLYRAGAVKIAAGDEIDLCLIHRLATGGVGATLTLGLSEPALPRQQAIAEVVAVARSTDVAVVVLDTGSNVGSEGIDRRTLALPRRQDQLVRAVAAANPNTVVVVNSGEPVDLSWHCDAPAVLISWLPGQEFGNALADVLFGRREPGGRLPTTWAVREEDVPVLSTRPRNGQIPYTEGLHVGYRAWAQTGHRPAYPFGHGLGYTTWAYMSIKAPATIRPGHEIAVQVQLANTGRRAGREVVQVYLKREASSIERPALWLAGFAIATASPGEEIAVEVVVEARAFQHWNTESSQWETELGAFTMFAGRSANDLRLRSGITLSESV